MFYSLAQTLICVLLIQGGMYALHLPGNSGSGSSMSSSSSGNSNVNSHIGSSSSSSSSVNDAQSLAAQHQSQLAANRMLHALGASFGTGAGSWGAHVPHQLQQQQQQQHHQHQQHTQHAGGGIGGGGGLAIGQHKIAGGGSSSGSSSSSSSSNYDQNRLNQELADMAQLERERLMLMGLAKQTAAAAAAAEGTGHHGRPIIAGRIQMQPKEELDVGDYPTLLQQAARGLMFGSVVKEPPPPSADDEHAEGDDYADEQQIFGRRPIKYDYGRIVQPADREAEYEAQQQQQQQQQQLQQQQQHQQHGFGDFDDFMELDAADEDDILADLDNYQYHGWEDAVSNAAAAAAAHHADNPYRTLEELELGAPEALQELFEKTEQRDAAAKQHIQQQQQQHGKQQQQYAGKAKTGAALPGYNIRMQQKWSRKRAQGTANSPYQRNIFGHHFNQQRNKLTLASSEATANKNKAITRNAGGSSSTAFGDDAANAKHAKDTATQAADKTVTTNDSQPTNDKKASFKSTLSAASSASAMQSAAAAAAQQQQQLLHPNHKRSGGPGPSANMGIGTAGGYMQTPPVSHSLASQLMLRTARGQRQYDVPQIECPTAMDGMERFACPTPDLQGRYRCIDDHVLCDGFIDCPEGEDEDRRSCMFYKTTKAHLDVLADALLRWARGR